MNSRGGCCIARYAGGGVYDLSKVDRVMLRFRPIAPKPVPGGTVSPKEKSELNSKAGRGKRRNSNSNNNNNNNNSPKKCNRRRRVSSEEKGKSLGARDQSMVTLPLLPEIPDPKETPSSVSPENQHKIPTWLSFRQGNQNQMLFEESTGRTRKVVVAPEEVRTVRSYVTVECVMDTWVVGDGLGSNDEEKKVNLARDTCPAFISDGMGRVTWMNEAYRKMVDGEGADMMVWLVMKERPMLKYPTFTCRVRVQYTCGMVKGSLTLPCDVWRMDGGGFAWRLDIKAALCLGR
ncbi:hypothetical protein SLE2022_294060 [Rubroshorea leprosula]